MRYPFKLTGLFTNFVSIALSILHANEAYSFDRWGLETTVTLLVLAHIERLEADTREAKSGFSTTKKQTAKSISSNPESKRIDSSYLIDDKQLTRQSAYAVVAWTQYSSRVKQ